MKSKFILLTFMGIIAYAADSSAQIFNIEVTDYGTAGSFSQFKDFVDAEIQKIENEINKDLPSGPPKRLMEGMANSSVMSAKGIGSDYASRMDVFLIGGGIGVGADMAKDKTTKSEISGAGVSAGVVLGANLGFMDTAKILGMDTNKLNLYLNFMDYTYKHKVSDKPNERSEAELDIFSIGTHIRYDWIEGSGSKWLGWGGVKIHAGYEYNKNDITFASQINEAVDQTDANGNRIQGTIQGNPVATINTATHSIPLEISTDVQLLYFLSLYTGLGVDYNWGQAKAKGNLNADESDITCTNANPAQACSITQTIKVQADANIQGTGKVNPFTTRGFVGVQFNLPYFQVYGQVDKAFGSELVGATAGLRFVF